MSNRMSGGVTLHEVLFVAVEIEEHDDPPIRFLARFLCEPDAASKGFSGVSQYARAHGLIRLFSRTPSTL